MSRIALVTDSTASLPPELAEQLNIHVIPAQVIFAGQTYRDGIDLTSAEFYEKLRAAPELPTTSQPSAGDFAKLYRSLSEEADAIISIHVSEHLSGTLASANTAKSTLDGVRIEIIDSRSVSLGLGLIVMAAARAISAGKSVEEIVMLVKDIIPKMNIVFVPETLKYLAKGGRIGGASALLGTVLQIKPVLCIEDGRIEVQEKVRSVKRARLRLIEIMQERMESAKEIHAAILHADCQADAEIMREMVAKRLDCAELYVNELGSSVGTHAGPGTMGIAFYASGT